MFLCDDCHDPNVIIINRRRKNVPTLQTERDRIIEQQKLTERYKRASGTYSTGGCAGQGSEYAYMKGFLAGAAAKEEQIAQLESQLTAAEQRIKESDQPYDNTVHCEHCGSNKIALLAGRCLRCWLEIEQQLAAAQARFEHVSDTSVARGIALDQRAETLREDKSANLCAKCHEPVGNRVFTVCDGCWEQEA